MPWTVAPGSFVARKLSTAGISMPGARLNGAAAVSRSRPSAEASFIGCCSYMSLAEVSPVAATSTPATAVITSAARAAPRHISPPPVRRVRNIQ